MKSLNFLIVILMAAASVWFYPALPDRLPMHWNIAGQVDSYWPKLPGVIFMPGLTLVMLILFHFLPQLDPKKDKYKLFEPEWNIIQTALLLFFAYLQYITFYLAINPQVNMLPLMFSGIGVLFVLLGNYLSKIRQNYFIGIKVPWTLSSEDNWNKTHRFAGWTFVLSGLVALSAAALPHISPVIVFTAIFLAGLLPVGYSFWLFRRSC